MINPFLFLAGDINAAHNTSSTTYSTTGVVGTGVNVVFILSQYISHNRIAIFTNNKLLTEKKQENSREFFKAETSNVRILVTKLELLALKIIIMVTTTPSMSTMNRVVLRVSMVRMVGLNMNYINTLK